MKDKVVLITGATSGIGKATALKFASEGSKVVLSGRREKEGQAAVDEIKAAGGEASFFRADVSKEEEVKSLVEHTIKAFGALDVAFNNAGVEYLGPLPETPHEDFERIFNINVWGVLTSMKYEIPEMIRGGGGAIINTSSVAGHIGMAGASVYVASKHAVEGLTKTAALEYASEGIRVNAVSPAAIETDMIERFAGPEGSEMRAGLIAMHPIGRLGKAGEIADAVYFLASDGAAFVTGESLKVDGGFLAK